MPAGSSFNGVAVFDVASRHAAFGVHADAGIPACRHAGVGKGGGDAPSGLRGSGASNVASEGYGLSGGELGGGGGVANTGARITRHVASDIAS